MEDFTEDHSVQLAGKDWLVKTATDGTTSTPYLFKFVASIDKPACCVIISDTKRVWAEVLDGKQLLRRWRSHNRNLATSSDESDAASRATQLQALTTLDAIHTIRGISLSSFSVVQFRDADFACEICHDDYTWQWHANSLGYRTSAELLSKHLILPLITFSDLAFASSEPLSQMPNDELEKAVDKNGRLYRRRVEAQVKKVVALPKFTTMLSRITGLYSSLTDLPAIKSELDETGPEVQVPSTAVTAQEPSPKASTPPSRFPATSARANSPATPAKVPAAAADSETEDESDPSPTKPTAAAASNAQALNASSDAEPSRPAQRKNKVPPSSETDSDSPRSTKKLKTAVVSDSDSSPHAKPAGRGGGVRQPIRRGGRRF